jgi:protein-tyrosine phosphatase
VVTRSSGRCRRGSSRWNPSPSPSPSPNPDPHPDPGPNPNPIASLNLNLNLALTLALTITLRLARHTKLVYVDDTAWDHHSITRLAAKLAAELPPGAVVVHNNHAGYEACRAYPEPEPSSSPSS